MRYHRNDLTADYVRSILNYNPETGSLTWKGGFRFDSIGRCYWQADKIAGTTREGGYLSVQINKRIYLAHRLIWLMMTGKWPSDDIDHIDRNPTNNRWGNLRLATVAQNNWNQGHRWHSQTGLRGVHFHKTSGLYRAQLTFKRKPIHIGYYRTPEEAHQAYCAVAKRLHGDFFSPD